MGNYWSSSSEKAQKEWIGNTQLKCSCLLTVINAASSFLALLVVQTNSWDYHGKIFQLLFFVLLTEWDESTHLCLGEYTLQGSYKHYKVGENPQYKGTEKKTIK